MAMRYAPGVGEVSCGTRRSSRVSAGPGASASRVPHHQFRFEDHLTVSSICSALFEEQLHGGASEKVAGLGDRGQGDRGRLRELDVVVTDDGYVLWDAEP